MVISIKSEIDLKMYVETRKYLVQVCSWLQKYSNAYRNLLKQLGILLALS